MRFISEKPDHVAVLGGGPAGLSAAWKLSEMGYKVTVIEKYPEPGGLCRTLQRGDFRFDLGGHRFLSQDREVVEEIVSLMGDALEQRPRTSVILLRGHYFKYPLDSKDLLLKMNPLVSLLCFLDYLFTRIKIKFFPRPDRSFEDWVVNRFGRSLYNIYFGPYSKKLWGVSPTKISADWSAQRISLLNLWDVFLRLLGKKKDQPKTYATEFYYPKGGIGQIAVEMVKQIRKNGGDIRLSQCVKQLTQTDGRIDELLLTDAKGDEQRLQADFYINTTPIDDLVKGLNPSPPQKVIDAVERMSFRGVLFLNLIIDLPSITDNTWMYIPEDTYFFFRIQEPRNWSESLVPTGKTSLILEISSTVGDEVWRMSEKDIYERCVQGLKKLNLFDVSKITDYFVSRVGHGYPIYDLDYKEYLTVAIEYVTQFENMISIGREGLYRYNNMDHSIKMGLLSARYVNGSVSLEEILAIASEQENFEGNQVKV